MVAMNHRRKRPARVAITPDDRAELALVKQAIITGRITPPIEALFFKYYSRHLSSYEPAGAHHHHD